jgi:hypothetical protein
MNCPCCRTALVPSAKRVLASTWPNLYILLGALSLVIMLAHNCGAI